MCYTGPPQPAELHQAQDHQSFFTNTFGSADGDPFSKSSIGWVNLEDRDEVSASVVRLRGLVSSCLPYRLSREEMEAPKEDEGGWTIVYFSPLVKRMADSIIVSLYAIAGGASLIVPMVVMSLQPSLKKSLITTSVAVVLFGLLAGVLDRKNPLNLTMAYAAVLVVFVGVGQPSPTS